MFSLQILLVVCAVGVWVFGAAAVAAVRWRVERAAMRELRLELAREEAELRSALQILPGSLAAVQQTRAHEAARHDLDEVEADLEELRQLNLQLPVESDYAALSDEQIDVRLMDILSAALHVNSIAAKYAPAAVAGYRGLEPDAAADFAGGLPDRLSPSQALHSLP